ncbi:MAG: 3,4-dihydroxy-2-butanone-4-phosphate synthase, partial [Candidatus Altiarchaeota archaeon]
GLIILIVAERFHQKLGLPFMVDVYEAANEKHPILENLLPSDIPYDTKSSFSLTINHRKTFTGITDNDRALTIREFSRVCEESEELEEDNARELLGKNFRSPGHIYICNASAKPLVERFGHTEYGVALLTMAGLTPVGTACEMMGDDGKALNKEMAKEYAKKHGLTFIEGKDIVEAWREWK